MRCLLGALLLLCTTEAWIAAPPSWRRKVSSLCLADSNDDAPKSRYDLGIGKHLPEGQDAKFDAGDATAYWTVPTPVKKPPAANNDRILPIVIPQQRKWGKPIRRKRLIARSEESKTLQGAVWDKEHFRGERTLNGDDEFEVSEAMPSFPAPSLLYPDIDLSIPETIYSETKGTDAIWELLRYDAYREAQREPLLVSFMYSTILNHDSLESALAFHLANRLSSPAMISTQIQSLILEALRGSLEFRRCLRADVMAVRDRDPACTCLPDAFLYFKGFHSLQTHRVAHYLYRNGRQVLAHYLQSQVSQNFQIDIHPNATLGAGIMLDHGTGIVIGETATVGSNCSILHHVTLGGSGKKYAQRHPQVGNGVLLGAGATVLGNVQIGDGCQVGAGTLVISDLPPHSVAVGVPAKIIGSFVNVTEQPSLNMNQMTGTSDFDSNIITFESGGI